MVFPLYLVRVGYGSAGIGLLLSGGGVATAALVALVGFGGDRYGRRGMLLLLAGLSVLGGLLLASSGNVVAVLVASGLCGVGRGGGAGSGGSWGPVFPAEQPLLAASVPPRQRTSAFGAIAFVGVLAGAAGSLVAWLPGGLTALGWSPLGADRAVFLLGALLSAAMLLCTLPLRETPPTAPPGPPAEISTRALVGRLGLTNALNGLGFGFLGPLLTYWFHVRYGAGAGEIGALYTLVNLVTALPYLGASRLAERLGALRAITLTRGASVLLLLVMAVMPGFWWAGAVYALRMAFNSLGLPTRQSFVMGVADERRRGMVAAVSFLPSQVTSAISPSIAGVLMEEGVLDTPLFGAALFMGANLIAYYFAFRQVRPPEEVARAGAGAGLGGEALGDDGPPGPAVPTRAPRVAVAGRTADPTPPPLGTPAD